MPNLPEANADTLRRLLALARDLLQAPTLGAILDTVGPALRDLLAAQDVLLLLGSGEHELVTRFDHAGRRQAGNQAMPLYRHAAQALQDRGAVLLADQPDRSDDSLSVTTPSVNLLALPFPPGDPVGVLAACWPQEAPCRHHPMAQVATMRYVCELIAAALGNAAFRHDLQASILACTLEMEKGAREHAEELGRRTVIEDDLQRIAITDVMTGMLNRRGFFLEAERSLKLARRRREPGALIFADVDGLKSVNDELGHEMGDSLIRDAAALLEESFRNSDVVARIGGDEFAAFTFDAAQPQVILARVQERIEHFHRQHERPYRVAFSTGIVACDPSSRLTLADYLALADQKMYENKRENRT
jgi:diguanylate cyclase (GGDEF)-like protein